jgi:hypothetical protein
MKSCIKRSTAFLERYDVQEIGTPVTSDFGLPTDVLNIIMERVVIGGRSEGVTRMSREPVLYWRVCIEEDVPSQVR